MRFLLTILLCVNFIAFSQEKTIKKIAMQTSIERLREDIYYLSDSSLKGRLIGTKGDSIAASYISDCFAKNHLIAPYQNGTSYIQSIITNRKDFLKTQLSIGNKSYDYFDGWFGNLRNMDSINIQNIPVVFCGYGIESKMYNDFENIDVKGKVVIILEGQPKNKKGIYALTNSQEPGSTLSYQDRFEGKGAVLILVCNTTFEEDVHKQQEMSFVPTYKNDYLPKVKNNTPVLFLSEEHINKLLNSSNNTIKDLEEKIQKQFLPNSFDINSKISLSIQSRIYNSTAPNVIGYIKGKDISDEYVLISAHHDHIGVNGKDIYFGAIDNASGVASLMEIVRLFELAIRDGKKPKRNIVFTSFTGEEEGLLGSYYFTEFPFFPLKNLKAVLNTDMLGGVDTIHNSKKTNSNYVYIIVAEPKGYGLRESLYKANSVFNNLELDTYYEHPMHIQRRLRGSDQYPFYLKKVPFIRIDCGFTKDYHQPGDTPDKINYELLANQVQLIFLTLWNIAND